MPPALLHDCFSFKYDVSLWTTTTILLAFYVNVALLFDAAQSRNCLVFGFACLVERALRVVNIV